MKTFAERLKMALNKRNISQAEAARRCGVSQQSINYIISNNLLSSKLAPQIASRLSINPEWLISGKGRFEEMKIYELPILHSAYMLKKFLQKEIDENTLQHTLSDEFLGNNAFAYLINPRKMALCYENTKVKESSQEYLTIKNDTILITNTKSKISFPIFEWRSRHVDF